MLNRIIHKPETLFTEETLIKLSTIKKAAEITKNCKRNKAYGSSLNVYYLLHNKYGILASPVECIGIYQACMSDDWGPVLYDKINTLLANKPTADFCINLRNEILRLYELG